MCANACQNDGICTSTHDEHYFSCSCPNNYTGERCDVALTPTTLPCPMLTEYCPPDLCLNNGTCVVNTFNFSSFFECSCPLGFTGVRCETETTPCEKNPCSGHTREPHCINLGLPLVEYMCVCQNGWGGPTCEVELNSCPTPVEGQSASLMWWVGYEFPSVPLCVNMSYEIHWVAMVGPTYHGGTRGW